MNAICLVVFKCYRPIDTSIILWFIIPNKYGSNNKLIMEAILVYPGDNDFFIDSNIVRLFADSASYK